MDFVWPLDRPRKGTTARAACSHLAPLAGRGRIASAIRVRGTLGIQRRRNDLQHAVSIIKHVVVPESKITVLMLVEPFVSLNIAFVVCVLPTVHFDDEVTFTAYKIHYERTDRLLPDELVPVQLTRA